jgi:hypothetical protein
MDGRAIPYSVRYPSNVNGILIELMTLAMLAFFLALLPESTNEASHQK